MTKIVVVTGCSRGLGFYVTQDLLKHGYTVVGISRTPTQLSSENFFHYTCDLSDPASVVKCAKDIVNQRGEVYALVNNAAIGNDGVLPTQHNSEILKMIQINLSTPILLSKYLSRSMLTQGFGRIINISSIVASTGYRGLSVYASTKGGLVAFTKSLARDLGSRRITVNAILPGFMKSEMTQGISEVKLKQILSRSPLQELVTFADVSQMIIFLLSDSGANITGTTITIDAGNTA